MNLYKYVSLGMFACICFLGGFLTGDWAAYDEKLVKEIRNSNSDHYEYATRAMELIYKTDELTMLLRVKKSDKLDEYISELRKYLSRIVVDLEKDIETYPFKEKNFIFYKEIERAKRLLSN